MLIFKNLKWELPEIHAIILYVSTVSPSPPPSVSRIPDHIICQSKKVPKTFSVLFESQIQNNSISGVTPFKNQGSNFLFYWFCSQMRMLCSQRVCITHQILMEPSKKYIGAEAAECILWARSHSQLLTCVHWPAITLTPRRWLSCWSCWVRA